MDIVFFNSWVSKTAIALYRDKPLYMGLANADLSRSSSLVEILTTEIALPGYTRQQLIIAGDGAYNSDANRHEMPTGSATFTPPGGGISWQFQTPFLLESGLATASISFDASAINISTDKITIANHGWTDGTKLLFTADTLGALFTAESVVENTILQVINPTTNDFQIAALGSSTPLNIQSQGSGTLRARTANGEKMLLLNEPQPLTLMPGQPRTYLVPLLFSNTGNSSGV